MSTPESMLAEGDANAVAMSSLDRRIAMNAVFTLKFHISKHG